MGRRRKKKVTAGEYYSVYIPKDIDPMVLKYLQSQPYLSKAIFKVLTDYLIDGKKTLNNESETTNNVEIDIDSINRTLKKTVEDAVKEALKNIKFESNDQNTLPDIDDGDSDDETINGISKSDLEFYGKLF